MRSWFLVRACQEVVEPAYLLTTPLKTTAYRPTYLMKQYSTSFASCTMAQQGQQAQAMMSRAMVFTVPLAWPKTPPISVALSPEDKTMRATKTAKAAQNFRKRTLMLLTVSAQRIPGQQHAQRSIRPS